MTIVGILPYLKIYERVVSTNIPLDRCPSPPHRHQVHRNCYVYSSPRDFLSPSPYHRRSFSYLFRNDNKSLLKTIASFPPTNWPLVKPVSSSTHHPSDRYSALVSAIVPVTDDPWEIPVLVRVFRKIYFTLSVTSFPLKTKNGRMELLKKETTWRYCPSAGINNGTRFGEINKKEDDEKKPVFVTVWMVFCSIWLSNDDWFCVVEHGRELENGAI